MKILIASAIFILCLIVTPTLLIAQTPQASKTLAFQQYQNKNAFKGIAFGSSPAQVNTKLDLVKQYDNIYGFENEEYLKFNNSVFLSGQAYFTKSGKLYQVVLSADNIINARYIYKQVKEDLLQLFGKNDHEFFNSKNRLFNISWEGVNIHITLTASMKSKDSNAGSVSLMIINDELNNLNHDEEFNRRRSAVPRI